MNIETAGILLQVIVLPCIVYFHSMLKVYSERVTILEENRKVQDEQLSVLNALVINMAELNIKLEAHIHRGG